LIHLPNEQLVYNRWMCELVPVPEHARLGASHGESSVDGTLRSGVHLVLQLAQEEDQEFMRIVLLVWRETRFDEPVEKSWLQVLIVLF
jgi:hypothetical protein